MERGADGSLETRHCRPPQPRSALTCKRSSHARPASVLRQLFWRRRSDILSRHDMSKQPDPHLGLVKCASKIVTSYAGQQHAHSYNPAGRSSAVRTSASRCWMRRRSDWPAQTRCPRGVTLESAGRRASVSCGWSCSFSLLYLTGSCTGSERCEAALSFKLRPGISETGRTTCQLVGTREFNGVFGC